jgi:1-aminocyclopropane-1-carboxylate deaminase/D-cysteine desulfhydrase-like pyridoxal-dependent ACC family enzyme
MLAIAHLARAKGWAFHYWCKRLPERVRDNPAGNLAEALRLGMRLHEVPRDRYEERVAALRGMAKGPDLLFIPQGGADPIAEAGVARLAGEVTAWAEEAGVTRFTVATPSGTGTTAFYLRKHLPDRVEVVTTPAVGDARVLEAQWSALEEGAARRPRILMRRPKWPFAKPNRDYLAIWRACEKAGILFDLLYAPKMWLELLAHYDELPRPILYIHSGGTSGNATQLEKYRYKGWL